MCSAASRRFGLLVSLAFVVVSLISVAAAQVPATETPAMMPPAATVSPSGQGTAPASGQMPQSPAGDPALQEPIANDQGTTFVFKKQVQEVILHATVVDEQRHLVPALDRNAFAVFDNGTPQAITSFRREDVPVAMGIVVDNSGSMRDKRNEVNQAVLNLIRASNPDDEIFVVNFSQSYYLDQDFTSDVNLLQTALHQVSATGSTALYDAIVASAVHLNNNRRLDKKVLLVITDGQTWPAGAANPGGRDRRGCLLSRYAGSGGQHYADRGPRHSVAIPDRLQTEESGFQTGLPVGSRGGKCAGLRQTYRPHQKRLFSWGKCPLKTV
jgi:hypothetical protein